MTVMCLFAITTFAQHRMHFRNVYKTVDTLVVKNIHTARPIMNGEHLITLPKEEKLILAYNDDKTKAIVLHGYMWGKRMEFNVKSNEKREVLWFTDGHIFCGYIYDIKSKSCEYFEAINEDEWQDVTDKFKFLKQLPTFTYTKEE